MEKEKFKLNIQLFADGDGGEGGASTPPNTGDGGTAGGEFEVPEYINSYVSGIEDEGQREYLTGLLKDEKGVNFLKGFVNDPGKEWDIKAEDYKDLPDNVSEYLEKAKEMGIPEAQAKVFLDNRKAYLSREREAMTPELKALDEPIANFINAEKDQARQGVYLRLSENAVGRQVLSEYMAMKNGGATPGIQGAGSAGGDYTHQSFIEAYNIALDENNQTKLKELRSFAENKKGQDSYFFDFIKD